MSGHSKWSTIKHKKALTDAKRGAIFTKIAKKIQIAAKQGGSGDPALNPILRTILDEARAVNMPNDNIKRAIDRALNANGEAEIKELTYEAYGPGGVGFIITAATDNHNRTGGEIKSIIDKLGGNLGSPGSVSYMKSISPIPLITLDEPDLTKCKALIEALEDHDDVLDVWTNLDLPEDNEITNE